MNYEKSYQLYLKKIAEQSVHTVRLKNGKEKVKGVAFLEPRSYAEFRQIYPVIKEYTGGKNVLREIVNQSRVTSTAQASAAFAIQQKLKKQIMSDSEADGVSFKTYTRGEFNRMSCAEIKEYFSKAYRVFQKEQSNGAFSPSQSAQADAWKQWKILRGIST